jgi:hypothetical protein
MHRFRVGGLVATIAVFLFAAACAPKTAQRATSAGDITPDATSVGIDGRPLESDPASPDSATTQRRGAHAFRSVVDKVPDDSTVVALHGRRGNDGTWAKPIDLQSALSGTGIKPGQTLLVRGGIYRGSFRSLLKGTADKPIRIAAFPGDVVVIDAGQRRSPGLVIDGAHTIFSGFEVRHATVLADGSRVEPADRSAAPGDGVEVDGPGIQLVDFSVHDNGTGIELRDDAIDAKIIGGAVYNNGYRGLARRPSPGIEIRNDSGTKLVSGTLVFNNFGHGIDVTGLGGNDGVVLDGVVAFDNGAPAGSASRNVLMGSSTGDVDRIRVQHGVFYHRRSDGTNIEIGSEDRHNGAAAFIDNHVLGGEELLALRSFDSLKVGDNLFVRSSGSEVDEPAIELWTPGRLVRSAVPDAYSWDKNTYVDVAPTAEAFILNSRSDSRALTFPEWRDRTGLDAASVHQGAPKTAPVVRLLPVAGRNGRANVTVSNPSNAPTVRVDLTGAGLRRGQTFEIRDAQNLGGSPVFSGTFNGSVVSLPMRSTSVSQPVYGGRRVSHTPPAFGAFVVAPV